ncbi:MAG: hypothetical protein WKF30_18735 [Pyrinomonadaceae bacterium]
MELNEEAQQIVRDFCAAINSAVEKSFEVADAIARLRAIGYELDLTLRLDIGLREHKTAAEAMSPEAEPAELELTDDDRRIFQRMKIRIDDLE